MFDDAIGMIYYNFRFYNPEIGKWINRDFVSEQNNSERNLYRYCNNIPNLKQDRLGLLTIIVHGTFASNEQWYRSGTFVDALNNILGDVWKITSAQGDARNHDNFVWSGRNNDVDRKLAGAILAHDLLRLIYEYPSEKINLIGHSHGGNVIIEALSYLAKYRGCPHKVDNVVLLGTPQIYLRNENQIILRHAQENIGNVVRNTIYNIYSEEDRIQTSAASLRTGIDEDDLAREGLPTDEILIVRRLNQSNAQNISIATDVGWYDAHGIMHSKKMGEYVAKLITGQAPDVISFSSDEDNDKGDPPAPNSHS